MKDFVIYGDSTCDLNKDIREKYSIEYLPMNFTIDDKEYIATLDWEFHTAKEHYDLMRRGKRVFTAQVPKNVYYESFKTALEKGKDILYISCSSALSASVNTALLVAKELSNEFPEAKICCVDSLISSLGQGYLLIEASKQRANGLTCEETARYIESIRLKVNQCGTVESMEYLRRAGRVKASKAFFGNLFGVKPIIISDIKGQNYAYKKVKGTANARVAIAEHIVNSAAGVYDTLLISHADCEEDALLLRDEILKRAEFKEVILGYIGPIVGASVGPGTVISFTFGEEVTIEGNE
ncbi:MAG: DegV family protein [Clostridia bacterium]|nr:DegV family protein [Clostridia bacterium]